MRVHVWQHRTERLALPDTPSSAPIVRGRGKALVHDSDRRGRLRRLHFGERHSRSGDGRRTKSKVTPKYKTKYRVKNWPTYEAALRKRGDITFWFDEDAVDACSAPPNGRPGGQRRYSDLAIVTALTLRVVFHFPLRQTEGFVASPFA